MKFSRVKTEQGFISHYESDCGTYKAHQQAPSGEEDAWILRKGEEVIGAYPYLRVARKVAQGE